MSECSEVHFWLPYPPSINHYYCRSKNSVYLTKASSLYIREVLLTVKSRIKFGFGNQKVNVTLLIYPPDRRKRDLDNILKCVLDVVQKLGVYDDDSQIDSLSLIRKEVTKGGGIDVVVKGLIQQKGGLDNVNINLIPSEDIPIID